MEELESVWERQVLLEKRSVVGQIYKYEGRG